MQSSDFSLGEAHFSSARIRSARARIAGNGKSSAPTRLPGARVVAQDRDLLDAAFLRRNARRLGLEVDVRETLFPADGLDRGSFDLVCGELSSPAGPAVAARELQEAVDLLAPGGEALVLASGKQERGWLPQAAPERASLSVLLRREGASVLRISRARGRR